MQPTLLAVFLFNNERQTGACMQCAPQFFFYRSRLPTSWFTNGTRTHLYPPDTVPYDAVTLLFLPPLTTDACSSAVFSRPPPTVAYKSFAELCIPPEITAYAASRLILFWKPPPIAEADPLLMCWWPPEIEQ